ncbi:PREDICTED: putative uncharacterized protein FRMD6-AS1 [Ceratotherium simum simum]|uniref:Uncharacterized protein n=1 Tax=Ceratotherium simum simum TaxID=73337 RepID=A0ABM1DAK3_CERSS|nr:PREDICTED: putative uncharacterized protein FRMD6-AS1 [Ceratotherium simum simum]
MSPAALAAVRGAQGAAVRPGTIGPPGVPEPGPSPAARPTARRCKLGPVAPARRPWDARELGESRGAREPGPPRQGVGVPRSARFRFRPGQRSSRRWSQTRRPSPAGHSSVRSGRSIQGSWSREKRRGAVREWGSGAWPCASPTRSQTVPPYGELREMALLCSLPFRRVKEGSVWNPGLRPMTRGLCSLGHGSAVPAVSGRVPLARTGLSICALRVTIGFKATPEDGQAFYRRGDTRRRLLWNSKPDQLARIPRPSLKFWNLKFVKYSFSSQVFGPFARENFVEHVQ